jgi:hypothetical protein
VLVLAAVAVSRVSDYRVVEGDAPEMKIGDAESVTKVTFGIYDKGGLETLVTFVPENLLWSPEGLSYLFISARKGHCANPSDYPGNLNYEEVWGSFHIISIEPIDGFMIDGLMANPKGGRR